MEGTVLVFLLCLHGGLLAGALDALDKPDCAGAGDTSRGGGRACVDSSASRARPAVPPLPAVQTQFRPILLPGRVQLTRMPRVRRQIDFNKKRKSMRTGAFSTSNITWNPEWLKASPTSSTKKLLEKISAPLKSVHHSGAAAIIMHPEHPFPTEWERRLQPAGSKKKPKRKARVGSFSLLTNNADTRPQVTRVRRQLNNEKREKRPKRPRTGTPFGESESLKVKRVLQLQQRKGFVCIMSKERCRCINTSSPEARAPLFPQHNSTHTSH